ncbi:MAG: hypothetical protein WCB14_19740 [Candidatus Acidiferrales bacterium]
MHLNDNGKLKTNAFRPKAGTDEVSVMRHDFMGSDGCKTKAREIAATKYQGLAVLRAREIREVGASVEDSRVYYCGHAHIAFGFVLPIGEPPTSDRSEQLVKKLQALKRAARYCADPNPSGATWTGETI